MKLGLAKLMEEKKVECEKEEVRINDPCHVELVDLQLEFANSSNVVDLAKGFQLIKQIHDCLYDDIKCLEFDDINVDEIVDRLNSLNRLSKNERISGASLHCL